MKSPLGSRRSGSPAAQLTFPFAAADDTWVLALVWGSFWLDNTEFLDLKFDQDSIAVGWCYVQRRCMTHAASNPYLAWGTLKTNLHGSCLIKHHKQTCYSQSPRHMVLWFMLDWLYLPLISCSISISPHSVPQWHKLVKDQFDLSFSVPFTRCAMSCSWPRVVIGSSGAGGRGCGAGPWQVEVGLGIGAVPDLSAPTFAPHF